RRAAPRNGAGQAAETLGRDGGAPARAIARMAPTGAPPPLGSRPSCSRRPVMESKRRRFLAGAAALGVGTLGLPSVQTRAEDRPKGDKKGEPEEEVGATEDLMREF